MYENNEDEGYTGQGIANAEDGMRQSVKLQFQKPVKISMTEIEKKFGYPIEIIQ